MQLPPALHSRLLGAPGAAEPLPVERDPAAGAPPFHFAARRVRFPRDHEFFEDVLTQVTGSPERPRVPEFTCQVAGCCQVFDSLENYEHHYHTLHRNVCSFCGRAFPSVHLLDVHILEWHDSLFQILSERQDMYQCLVEGCAERFRSGRDRKEHLVRRHLYPADFRFDKPKRSRGCARRGARRAPELDKPCGRGDAAGAGAGAAAGAARRPSLCLASGAAADAETLTWGCGSGGLQPAGEGFAALLGGSGVSAVSAPGRFSVLPLQLFLPLLPSRAPAPALVLTAPGSLSQAARPPHTHPDFLCLVGDLTAKRFAPPAGARTRGMDPCCFAASF
ncbi:zinc finger protein 511 isoform X2 [Enhydra lutris kenyoni]|uniref:Zinc finger protein 511 isoform X2 n=1 Tax=Enhydra lutris kenyoni TaxID=391180 RepID=A0A2Y9J640_ENHLU|nr:zinc finger protein 511 isoform X2 [Enhydra lutris kenyoni]